MLICHKKRWVGIFLISTLLFLPGCWSHRELNEIGIVSAIGLDLSEQGKLQLTVQVNTPQTPVTKGQFEKQPVRILTSEGETFFDAVRDLMTKSGDRLFYPHTQIIVIGEEVARAGIHPFLDFLQRDPELRLFTWVILTEGKAEEVLRAPSAEELISANHLSRLVKDYESTSKSIPVNLLDFSNKIYSEGIEPAIGKVEFIEEKGEPTFRMEGGGAFKGDKLIDWLNGEEARGYLWVHDDIKGGIIATKGIEAESSSGVVEGISFEIIKGKTKVKPVLVGDELRFVIDIDTTCYLGERMDGKETTTREAVEELEKILTQAVIKETQVIVDKAQKELKSDILGFGVATNRKYPDYWKQHKEGWDEIFPNLDVEILVKAVIDDRGAVR